MKKILILLLITLLVPNSAQAGSKKAMQAVLESWQGENINSVIERWGYPSDEKVLAGKKLLYWTKSKNSFYYQNGYGSYVTEYCERILETDNNNIVIAWQWKGNSCPFVLKRAYKNYGNPQLQDKYINQKSNKKE